MINSFTDQYFFLSNFAPSSLYYKNHRYLNAEAAFQAQKCPGIEERFENLDPSQARRWGRMLPLREDWEEVKLKEMENILKAKFRNYNLRKKLLETGEQELVEGNYWKDDFWGVCTSKGQNNLGKLLMKLRSEYRTKEEKKAEKRVRANRKEKKFREIQEQRSLKNSLQRAV